jgi:uncharacterized protein (TIGR03435 family)
MKHFYLGLLLLVAPLASAQNAAPLFTVASVKPSSPAVFQGISATFYPGGRFVAKGMTARDLIATAYGLSTLSPRLVGGPDWIDRQRFDVEAKVEAGTLNDGLAAAQVRELLLPALQRLLADRFHLVIQKEQKPMPVFELRLAQSGSKLPGSDTSEEVCRAVPAVAGCHDLSGSRSRGLRGSAATVGELASLLEMSSDQPIVDATGLKGLYVIKMGQYSRVTPELPSAALESRPADRRPPDEPWPSVFDVLEKELGLRLVPTRAPVEMLKIESIERPSGN